MGKFAPREINLLYGMLLCNCMLQYNYFKINLCFNIISCIISNEIITSHPIICILTMSNYVQQSLLRNMHRLLSVYQDTWLCVSGQESHAAHKCVIYRTHYDTVFNTSYLYNYWSDFYKIYIFYTLHIHNCTCQIGRK